MEKFHYFIESGQCFRWIAVPGSLIFGTLSLVLSAMMWIDIATR
ncbi:hypothetical protein [Paraburkholderia sp.]|nr:hypothetical protein [Paraburkholderia sp.]MDE1181081.1 hypothetical protein [Paraburkholderia sp.]